MTNITDVILMRSTYKIDRRRGGGPKNRYLRNIPLINYCCTTLPETAPRGPEITTDDLWILLSRGLFSITGTITSISILRHVSKE